MTVRTRIGGVALAVALVGVAPTLDWAPAALADTGDGPTLMPDWRGGPDPDWLPGMPGEIIKFPKVNGLPNPFYSSTPAVWADIDVNPVHWGLPAAWLPPGYPDISTPLPVEWLMPLGAWGVRADGMFVPLPASAPRG